MRVFITGASGFIGSALVRELVGAGNEVLGLARSDESAAAIAALGAEVHRGSTEDPASIVAGALKADATVHLAFNHDFSRFAENSETDRRTVEALGTALAGTGKHLVVTSGVLMCKPEPGTVATEDSPVRTSAEVPRAATEEACAVARDAGCSISIVRLPQVHDTRRQGLITYAIAIAREKGVSAYLGQGANRWSAAHVSDVARLYRLAVEKREAGAIYHAVAEEGVPMRAVAETLARQLGVPAASIDPADAEAHFGWFAHFASLDVPTSSAATRRKLGWEPSGRGLIADLEQLELEDA